MAENLHPLAPHHIPSFIPSADGSDPLMVGMAVFLLIAVFSGGIFYLHLHSIPERRMHGAGKAQFEIVAVLGLIALLTHNNLFWIAALILAMIDLPNISGPLNSISESLGRIAGTRAPAPEASGAADSAPPAPPADAAKGGGRPCLSSCCVRC